MSKQSHMHTKAPYIRVLPPPNNVFFFPCLFLGKGILTPRRRCFFFFVAPSGGAAADAGTGDSITAAPEQKITTKDFPPFLDTSSEHNGEKYYYTEYEMRESIFHAVIKFSAHDFAQFPARQPDTHFPVRINGPVLSDLFF